jgi:hypothetical protein
MNGDQQTSLLMPGGSWEQLKKIIRAYQAVGDQENPRVEDVSRLAGLQRSVVSGNNNFLRSAGFLQENENKLTPLGSRLATGLGLNNESLISGTLQEIIRAHGPLSRLVNMVKARGQMREDDLRAEIIMLAGLNENSRTLAFIKTVIDLLAEAKLIQQTAEGVFIQGTVVADVPTSYVIKDSKQPEDLAKRPSENDRKESLGRIPIPLGLGRLAYIDLPSDWSNKDLPKFLKLVSLALGDGEEQP